MVWYNKYRPTSFDQVIGQDLVKSVLINSISKNTIKHAYLFCGSKGVGKTTLARIFANNLNKIKENPENKIDIIEIDAASNSSVENIRQLVENAQIPPINAIYKIYIIDEVHMLSKTAMNALLKILEEPPNYLIFLLATTNPEKIIPTVLSRLTKLNLSTHSKNDLMKNLSEICLKENLNLDQKAIEIIAKRANGSQRDAINLLQTIGSYDLEKYSEDQVAKLLGFLPEKVFERIAFGFLEGFKSEMLIEIENFGMDGESFLGQFLDFLLDRSFGGNKDLEELILPVSDILSLKLNFTSIISAISLVLVKLNENKITSKNPIQKNSFRKTEEAKLDIIKSQVKKNEFLETNPTTESKKPAAKLNLTNSSLDEFQKILVKIINSKNSPAVLKMLSGDLEFTKIEEKTIFLSTSNGIFLSQLNSSKLQKYLLDEFKQNLQTDFTKIKLELRLTKNTNSGSESFLTKENLTEKEVFEKVENENSSFYANTEENLRSYDLEHQNLKNISNLVQKSSESNIISEKNNLIAEKSKDKLKDLEKSKNLKSGQIFYQVYSQLPENFNSDKISVIKKPIPKPEAKKIESWEEIVEEMFDLE
jgi:DNA polymerase III subunit gamma/tau